MTVEGRHPATQHLLQFFAFEHLPAGPIRNTSAQCSTLAHNLAGQLPDGAELSAGLRKLLEAKDCFVRTAVAAQQAG